MIQACFNNYRKAFPELNHIVYEFQIPVGTGHRPVPLPPEFIRIKNIDALNPGSKLSDFYSNSRTGISVGRMELWAASEEGVTKVDTLNHSGGEEYVEGGPIGGAINTPPLHKIAYFALLDYWYSSKINQTFSTDGIPGDIRSSEDFLIDIYESPDHYQNRSRVNKGLDFLLCQGT